jgi:S1-C subfamily serine protease
MQDDQGNGSGQQPEESGPEHGAADQGQYGSREPGQPGLSDPFSSGPTIGFEPPGQAPGPDAGPAQESPGPFSPPDPNFSNLTPGAGSFGTTSSGSPGYGASQPSGPVPPSPAPYFAQSQGAGQPYAPGQPGQPGQAAQPGQPGYGHPAFSPTAPFGYQGGGYGQPGGYGQAGGFLPPSSAARRGRNLLTYLIVAVVAAAAGAGATAFFVDRGPASVSASGPQGNGGNNGGTGGGGNGGVPLFPDNPGNSSGGNSHSGISPSTERTVINAIKPGLVDISSNLQYQGSQAAATGMVISSDGLVLTNNHVITDTTQLYAVVVATGQRFSARWLGYDSTDDVAVIKLISAHGLKTVPLGDSSKVKLGDGVVAMGNADGAGGVTPAPGRITGLNRTITASDSGEATSETLHGMFQTDAGIVQGDSGGALASADGHVIGMNTAAATGNVGNGAVGFAIPINKALAIADKIIHGQASKKIQIGSTGFMGVLVPAGDASKATDPKIQRARQLEQDQSDSNFPVQPATPSCLANDLTAGVPGKVAPVRSGALVIGELCSTPADMANIIAGDVITAVGKDKVTSPSELTQIMTGFKPGDSVQVTWVDIRGGVHHRSMTLIEAPPH